MRTQICAGIFRVGVVDWNNRDFHGYAVHKGVTYNSYLVKASQKTALIDAVKAPFVDGLVANLAAHGVRPQDVDYLVVNHAELDHAGGLPAMMRLCTRAELVCDAKCRKTLEAYFDTADWRFKIVAEGDTLSLGDKTLAFVETPMAHWPESMVTYVPEDKVLFSMDAFGQHYPTVALLDEECPLDDVLAEMRHYYANILMPLARTTASALGKAAPLALDYICPSHGVIWHKHIGEAVAAYAKWTAAKTDKKLVIVYDTMWQSTELMAKAVLEGASDVEGVQVRFYHLRSTPMSDIMDELLEADALALGSPTQNNWYMPQIGAFLTAVQGLRPPVKFAQTFGSSGWSRGGADKAFDTLKAHGIAMIADEPIRCFWRPTPAVLEQCKAAGRALAQKVKDQA